MAATAVSEHRAALASAQTLSRSIRGFGLALAIVALASIVGSGSIAHAATFEVTTCEDKSDGTCDGDCSLREALEDSNGLGGSNAIEVANDCCFDPGTGALVDACSTDADCGGATGSCQPAVYELDPALGELTISALTELLEIRAGSDIVIDGAGQTRVLKVQAEATAVLIDIHLRNGMADRDGGCLRIDKDGLAVLVESEIEGCVAGRDGGGIFNAGVLMVIDSLVHDNHAMRDGGGIYSNVDSDDGERAALTLLDSTISDNVADRDGGGVANYGVINEVDNVEIIKNFARHGDGGGLFDGSDQTNLVITDSRVNDNAAGGDGGGIFTLAELTVQDGPAEGADAEVKRNTTLRSICTNVDRYGEACTDDAACDEPVDAGNGVCGLDTANGGGIFSGGALAATLDEVELEDNCAIGNGGGIFTAGGLTGFDTDAEDNNAGRCCSAAAKICMGGANDTANCTLNADCPGGVCMLAGADFGDPCEIDSDCDNGAGTCSDDGSTARDGGGVYSLGDVNIDSWKIEGNDATGDGGGVFASVAGGSVLMTRTDVDENEAANGGGMHVSADSLSLVGIDVKQNRAEIDGGGIWTAATTSVLAPGLCSAGAGIPCAIDQDCEIVGAGLCSTIKGNTVDNNVASDGDGGGVHAVGSLLRVLGTKRCVLGANAGMPCESDLGCPGGVCPEVNAQRCMGGVRSGQLCWGDDDCFGLCVNDLTRKCTADRECAGSTCSAPAAGACPNMRFCKGGTRNDSPCVNNLDCPGGRCPEVDSQRCTGPSAADPSQGVPPLCDDDGDCPPGDICPTITDIDDNVAGGDGGGIFTTGELVAHDSSIDVNSAVSVCDEGKVGNNCNDDSDCDTQAICVDDLCDDNSTACTDNADCALIDGLCASGSGGGIFEAGKTSRVSLVNAPVKENRVVGNGGGIYDAGELVCLADDGTKMGQEVSKNAAAAFCARQVCLHPSSFGGSSVLAAIAGQPCVDNDDCAVIVGGVRTTGQCTDGHFAYPDATCDESIIFNHRFNATAASARPRDGLDQHDDCRRCSAGANVGRYCASSTDCPSGTCLPGYCAVGGNDVNTKHGGGIYSVADDGLVQLTETDVNDNLAEGDGGGMFVCAGDCEKDAEVIAGGHVSVELNKSTLGRNRALGDNVELSSEVSPDFGDRQCIGGTNDGQLCENTVPDCPGGECKNVGEGGGLLLDSTSDVELQANACNATLSENLTGRREFLSGWVASGTLFELEGGNGGGVNVRTMSNEAEVNLNNVTLGYNRAGLCGGGLWHCDGAKGDTGCDSAVIASNTGFCDNVSTCENDATCAGGISPATCGDDCYASLFSRGSNLATVTDDLMPLADPAATDCTIEPTNPKDKLGIPGAELNCLLSPLGRHGGLTETNVPGFDSPLLDAASFDVREPTDDEACGPRVLGECEFEDERGVFRPLNNGPKPEQARCDIGAYESGCGNRLLLNDEPFMCLFDPEAECDDPNEQCDDGQIAHCFGGERDHLECEANADCPDIIDATGFVELGDCQRNGDGCDEGCMVEDGPATSAFDECWERCAVDPVPGTSTCANSATICERVCTTAVCTAGPAVGSPCTSDLECGTGGECGDAATADVPLTLPNGEPQFCAWHEECQETFGPNSLCGWNPPVDPRIPGSPTACPGSYCEHECTATTPTGTVAPRELEQGYKPAEHRCDGGSRPGQPCESDADCDGGSCPTLTCESTRFPISGPGLCEEGRCGPRGDIAQPPTTKPKLTCKVDSGEMDCSLQLTVAIDDALPADQCCACGTSGQTERCVEPMITFVLNGGVHYSARVPVDFDSKLCDIRCSVETKADFIDKERSFGPGQHGFERVNLKRKGGSDEVKVKVKVKDALVLPEEVNTGSVDPFRWTVLYGDRDGRCRAGIRAGQRCNEDRECPSSLCEGGFAMSDHFDLASTECKVTDKAGKQKFVCKRK